MKIPSWVGPTIVGIFLGAAIISIIGFNWWGWTTSGAAQELAEEQSEQAVTTLIVSLFTQDCVNQAENNPELLAELAMETSSFQQEDFIAEAGWATLPGQEEPNEALAESCLEELEGTLEALADQEL